ncbi:MULTISPECIES: C40 family peptidase [unclassified Lactobacillus]|uniref:C40 family peptidase n=1 Tax=unclassified Lactobacillus TaxID=2620435 RepID=UPI000EFBE143|nr:MULTISPECIES: C40 family peptidase [unclassified Lactobacillus]RMC38592.1 NlpC/P60 family protein [Lactobacillus sp. ESL0237]RMC42937.1 NlpC/P60 family protein [Lactobacillus sp. ESL0234]RMC43791.1 NlpC/P60 family protein [Lactobacillus sp. ESL0236]RMC44794.1 NlpC/P60 family protein [Lactobacillus sp. ESL0230]
MKRNFWKMGLATTLTMAGVTVVAPLKSVNATTMKAPIKRVQINYLPGKGVKIWTNYEGGQLITFRAKNNSKWNVAEIAIDRKDRLWYKIGENEWIEARYTIDLEKEKPNNKKQLHLLTDKVSKGIKNHKKTKGQKVEQQLVVPTNKPKNNRGLNTQNMVNAAQRIQAVVDMAKAKVGKGYVWGGNGPNNFDCSGLVQYIYNQVGGVKLPRVTTDQVKVGSTVSMDKLKPGDLLYWGAVNAPYHIGIYIGNNQFIHAATPEQGVVQQVLSSYFYPCVAKRVIF